MRRAAALGLVAAAAGLGGCGYSQPDLFRVERTGEDRNANVTFTVNDGGTVKCGGRDAGALPGEQLLEARELARDLEQEATLAIELPPADNSVLRYRVRTQTGSVAFSDTSEGRPRTFDRLAAFSKDVIEDRCGIER